MPYEPKPNSGSLFKNERKTSDKHPDYTGTWKDADGKEWQLAAWVKEGKKGKFFSVSASQWRESSEPKSNSDLPF